jgi:hypothetical protein
VRHTYDCGYAQGEIRRFSISQERALNMPTSKEFTLGMEDRPGTLGKFSRALADRGVNIVAFQSFPSEGKSLFRIVVDNPTTAKTVLDTERLTRVVGDP